MKSPYLSRRKFLQLACAGTCGSVIHQVVTPGFATQAFAQLSSRAAFTTDPIAIVINLAGGPSYNIAPIYAGAWRDKNPTISYSPEDSLPLTSGQGLHPSLTYFQQLYQAGDLALINKIGYPNHSRSHNTAARMWMTGNQNPMGKDGMLNLLSCQTGGLYGAISLAGDDPIISGSCSGARKLESLATLNGINFRNNADETEWINRTRKDLMNLDTNSSSRSKTYVRNAIVNMDDAAETIREQTSQPLPNVGVQPPQGGFGNDAEDAAKLLQAASSTGTRTMYLEKGGFDTHSNERNSMPGNLRQVNDSVRYLAEVSKALGIWDRVVIIVMGEFARTFENSSQGSDHGNAAPAFIMGGRVNGGRLVSPTPTSAEIQSTSGFLRGHQVDTRNFYEQVILGMGFDPGPVFGEQSFDRTNLSLFL